MFIHLNTSDDIGCPCSVPQRISIFSGNLLNNLTFASDFTSPGAYARGRVVARPRVKRPSARARRKGLWLEQASDFEYMFRRQLKNLPLRFQTSITCRGRPLDTRCPMLWFSPRSMHRAVLCLHGLYIFGYKSSVLRSDRLFGYVSHINGSE